MTDAQTTVTMLSSATFAAVAAFSALQAHGMAVDHAKRANPTVYLAGDSTMAKMGSPIDGRFSLNSPVLNIT